MLLDRSGRPGDAEPDAVTVPAGRSSDVLAALVTIAFPTLAMDRRRVEQSGGDHVLLIVDEHFAFRFPRAGMHDLNLEIEVLKRLQRNSILPTPSYDYVDPDGRFAGYPYLEGLALTPARFAALSRTRQEEGLNTAALFLSELHGLSPDAIAPPERWPTIWTAAEFAERGLTERLPLIARHCPAHAAAVEAFYVGYCRDRPDRHVVVHGDLVAEHILLNARTGRLSGIIDFGDVALGDPAQDFLGFWAYGAQAACRAVALYRPVAADAGLLARSRHHFIRYRLDRLCERLRDEAGIDPAQIATEIDALLDRC